MLPNQREFAVAFDFSHVNSVVTSTLAASLKPPATQDFGLNKAILETSYQLIGAILVTLIDYVNHKKAPNPKEYSDSLHSLAESIGDYFDEFAPAVDLVSMAESMIMDTLVSSFPEIDNCEILDFETQGVNVWLKVRGNIHG